LISIYLYIYIYFCLFQFIYFFVTQSSGETTDFSLVTNARLLQSFSPLKVILKSKLTLLVLVL